MPYDYKEKTFYVYIVASQRKGTLYTGMTADIARRAHEHANGIGQGFSAEHHTDILVYIEPQNDFKSARLREKRIKEWKRAWKIRLIESKNPTWMDLCRRVGASRGDGLTPMGPVLQRGDGRGGGGNRWIGRDACSGYGGGGARRY